MLIFANASSRHIPFHWIFITGLCGRIVVATLQVKELSLGKWNNLLRVPQLARTRARIVAWMLLSSNSRFSQMLPPTPMHPPVTSHRFSLHVLQPACAGALFWASPSAPCPILPWPVFWIILYPVSLMGCPIYASPYTPHMYREQSRCLGRKMLPKKCDLIGVFITILMLESEWRYSYYSDWSGYGLYQRFHAGIGKEIGPQSKFKGQ